MKRLIPVASLAAFCVLGVATIASAAPDDKITICHAAGLDGTTHFITLTISENAVYGPAGHFNENGTTQAGHEQDYFGACIGDEPSGEPSDSPSDDPSSEPTPTPTPEVTPTPEITPSPTPRPTPTTSGNPPPSEIPVSSFDPIPSVPATDTE